MSFDNFKEILSILIGPIGIVLGIVINEHFRKKSQESIYGEEIFKKRFAIYETLYEKVQNAYEVGDKLLSETKSSREERLQKWAPFVLDLAAFLDKNRLYINENISAHVAVSMVGVEDVAEMEGRKLKKTKDDYLRSWKQTEDLIKEDSGLKRLEEFFGKINKPNLTSDWIEYMEKLKKRQQ